MTRTFSRLVCALVVSPAMLHGPQLPPWATPLNQQNEMRDLVPTAPRPAAAIDDLRGIARIQ